MKADRTPFNPRRRMLLGAVAVLAALAVAGVALAVATRDDGDDEVAQEPELQTSTIDTVGAETDDAAASAVGVVEAAYEAFNSGDLDGWLVAEAPADVVEFFTFELAVEAVKEDVRCDYIGFGEYMPPEDGAAVEPLTGHRIECSGRHANAFTEAAGIEVPETYVWVVNDGRVIYSRQQADAPSGTAALLSQFLTQYLRWLRTEHPDVAETLTTPLHNFQPHIEDAPALLSHVDDFVAQSDQWPVDEN